MARPLVLAACLVLGFAGDARAGGKTSKVTIETDPPGAKVYFNVKEDGEVCTTPCTIEAPIGETPIIVEAENRRSIIENLIVPKKTARPMRVLYKLKPALGTLVIEGGEGAMITLDDEDQGTAPRRFEDILAGAHHVVLQKNGKKIYDAFVEVEIGGEASVSAAALAPEPPAPPRAEAPAIAATRAAPPSEPRRPELAVSAVTSIGFRQFSFHYPSATANKSQQNDSEGGQVLTGAIVELWPTTLLGLGVVPGFALHARFQIGLNPQQVTTRDAMGKISNTTLTTAWRSLEISLRHRWRIADTGTIEVGAGYTSDRYQFTSDDPIRGPTERAAVPDASYKAVRIGGRASLVAGVLEPYLAGENRIVLSGGVLESRYALGASAVGYHAALGTLLHLGHFEIRAEGSVTLYAWTFRPDSHAADEATSGSDVIEQIGLAVGYTY